MERQGSNPMDFLEIGGLADVQQPAGIGRLRLGMIPLLRLLADTQNLFRSRLASSLMSSPATPARALW